jgi:hypothetical protein
MVQKMNMVRRKVNMVHGEIWEINNTLKQSREILEGKNGTGYTMCVH